MRSIRVSPTDRTSGGYRSKTGLAAHCGSGPARPQATIAAGLHGGRDLGAVIEAEGAQVITVDEAAAADESWPTLVIGPTAAIPARPPASAPVLRALWTGWTASVAPARPPTPPNAARDNCVLAAIAAAAMGISETFNVLRGRPGNDAGYRPVSLNLWNPGQSDGDGPVLRYAPVQWWLVGLGHLGQAYSWGLSWLDYAEPSLVQVVLQETDRTTPANRSTGILTPAGSTDVPKTRLSQLP